MKLYGKEYDAAEVRRRVGRMSQIMGAREIEFRGGLQHGVKAVEMYNDTGLIFTVMVDKGMDIADAQFCGKSITWQCKNGIVGPQYFENSETGFFRGFVGGLVGTCGYTQVGTPCKDGDTFLGLHDRADNIPAERYYIDEYYDEDEIYTVKLTGFVRQSCLYQENILVKREITIKQGQTKIWLKDTIKNDGYNDTPFMLMYHVNFGWPVVSEDSEIWSPAKRLLPEAGGERENAFPIPLDAPIPNFGYECAVHDLPRKNGVAVGVINRKLEYGAYIKIDAAKFPSFNTWRMSGEQDYVFAVEPGTNAPMGRVAAREKGELIVLKALEEKEYGFELGIIPDAESAEAFIAEIKKMKE